MEKWIKIGLKIARPHIAIVFIETIAAFTLLIYSALCLSPSDILSIVAYVMSFYSLVIVCFRIPDMIRLFKHIRNDNKYNSSLVKVFLTSSNLVIKMAASSKFFLMMLFSKIINSSSVSQ